MDSHEKTLTKVSMIDYNIVRTLYAKSCPVRKGIDMRVIAGKARRLLLRTPSGTETRPTSDQIKETLFNILAPELSEAYFLDLFAGSGGIGIEALSRGAEYACFVENQREALVCIRENLNHTRLADQATVYGTDVLTAIRRMETEKRHFDVIFADPPYRKDWERVLLETLSKSPIVDGDTLIVIETALDNVVEQSASEHGFEVHRVKTYKTNQHWFLYRAIVREGVK